MNGPKADRRKKRKSKVCTSCGTRKPLKQYYKNAASLDGHGVYCKTCTFKKRKKWINANREHSLKLSKAYRDSHKLEIAKYHEKYYANPKNAKRQAQYQKEYKKRKAKYFKEYLAQYNKENKERIAKRALEYYYRHWEKIAAKRAAKRKLKNK